MDTTALLAGLALGLLLAGAYALIERRRARNLREQLLIADGRIAQLTAHNQDLSAAQRQQGDLDLLLKPLREGLAHVAKAATEADRRRAEAEAQLLTLITETKSTNDGLSAGVHQLVAAMSKGQTRGRWGEMQLEQLLAHSGLLEGTHFKRQDSRDDGAQRPDLVILMPGGGEVLIDAKFPFDAYFEAMGTDDAALRSQLLQKHARDLAARVNELSRKEYAAARGASPDYVVLFLPLEPLLGAALDQDGLLLERAFEKRVVLATPTTVLALLRTIGLAWNRHDLAVNAEQIRTLGAEMLTRLGTVVGHLNAHGRALRRAVDSFNDVVGSFDTRLVKQAERMQALGVPSGKPLALDAELANDVHQSRTEPTTEPPSPTLGP